MENRRPVIDRSKCIKCFCCQEFCPKGAMKVHRTWIARMLEAKKKQ
jgi:formate hydrogenlyase subunit 6/NADH:ubiquinone oxidoreductase subunit I